MAKPKTINFAPTVALHSERIGDDFKKLVDQLWLLYTLQLHPVLLCKRAKGFFSDVCHHV